MGYSQKDLLKSFTDQKESLNRKTKFSHNFKNRCAKKDMSQIKNKVIRNKKHKSRKEDCGTGLNGLGYIKAKRRLLGKLETIDSLLKDYFIDEAA